MWSGDRGEGKQRGRKNHRRRLGEVGANERFIVPRRLAITRFEFMAMNFSSLPLQHSSKEISMPKCKNCDGRGAAKCPRCHGKGRVSGGLLSSSTQCKNCQGSGVVKCGVCQGKGWI